MKHFFNSHNELVNHINTCKDNGTNMKNYKINIATQLMRQYYITDNIILIIGNQIIR